MSHRIIRTVQNPIKICLCYNKTIKDFLKLFLFRNMYFKFKSNKVENETRKIKLLLRFIVLEFIHCGSKQKFFERSLKKFVLLFYTFLSDSQSFEFCYMTHSVNSSSLL